jgi:hypothetical protein
MCMVLHNASCQNTYIVELGAGVGAVVVLFKGWGTHPTNCTCKRKAVKPMAGANQNTTGDCLSLQQCCRLRCVFTLQGHVACDCTPLWFDRPASTSLALHCSHFGFKCPAAAKPCWPAGHHGLGGLGQGQLPLGHSGPTSLCCQVRPSWQQVVATGWHHKGHKPSHTSAYDFAPCVQHQQRMYMHVTKQIPVYKAPWQHLCCRRGLLTHQRIKSQCSQEIQIIMNPPHLEDWGIEMTGDGFAMLCCDSGSHWQR